MTKPKRAWMVRAGSENELADLVEVNSAVAIGWAKMGDVSGLRGREQFKQRFQEVYPDVSPARISVNAGQMYRFAQEMHEDDYVLTYIKASREVLIGLVEGPYEYRKDVFPDRYPHMRRVQWLRKVSRDDFSAPARNSMGGLATVFQLDEHLEEIHRIATATEEAPATPGEGEELPFFFEEVKARADELIADIISRLDPYDFQDLVAAVLRAMGFRAVSTSPGSDRGVDIIAHSDPFGFEQPRIKVQVKHRKGTVGGPEMRAFLGSLRTGDSGLYVSTGGFSDDAKRETERSREPVALLDRDGFIQLLLEHYEALDPEYKARVPLRKLWVPAG
ncbi:MAG: restriction endonuclease [Chloroflexi bacterium]|nr:restriction endonuclease [Chloroflexota bacterium]